MISSGFALLVLGAAVLVAQPRTSWLGIFEGPAVVACAAGAMLAVSGFGGGLGWGLLGALAIVATALAPRYRQRQPEVIAARPTDAP